MALESLSSNILPGEVVAPTEDPAGGLTTVKAPTSKGGFNVGSVAINPTNTAEILANMQKFLDERKQTDADKFVQGLNAASLSLYHPEAFVEYQKANQAKDKDYMDMQNQMAALKGAQAMQANQRIQLEQELAKNGGAPTDVAVGQNAQNGPAAPVAADSDIDPRTMADIKGMIKMGDTAGARKLYQSTLAEINKNKLALKYSPTSTEITTVNGPNGTQYQTTRAEAPALIKRLWGNDVGAAQPALATEPAPAVTGGIQPKDIGKVESGNKPFAVGPNVPGQGQAKSSMQVMDATGTDPGFGVKPAQLTGDPVHDEAERTRVGSDYFNVLKTKYGNDTLASIAYNMGPGATDKWLAAGADVSKLPAETKDYVAKAHIANATSGTAKPAAPAAAAPAAGGSRDQIQAVIDTLPKPDPRAPKEQWDRYKQTIDDLRAQLASAPIKTAQKASDITTSAKATNSAAEEKALHESSGVFSTNYMNTVGELEKIANDPKNEKIFAIGNKKDPFSKAAALGQFTGLNKDKMKEIYKRFNPDIKDEDLANMEQYDKGSSQIVAAYVHDTFPGRILASELSLGGTAKGVGIGNQRESNAASLASIRSVYELKQNLEKGLADYRAKHGADAPYQDFKESPDFKNIVDKSAKELHDKFPKYYPYTDKFAKYKKSENK